MRIITADPTGLCFGVKRAITTLEEELKKGRRVFALGSPIHNPQEIARLEKRGSSSSIRRKRCRRARYLLCGRTE